MNLWSQKNFFDIDGLDEETIPFSLLSTAVGYESILTFVSKKPDIYPDRSSIRLDSAQHLCTWLYQRKDQGQTILGESRKIQDLAVIAADERAIKLLVEGDSLEKAYSITRGVSDDFTQTLIEIEELVTRAVTKIALVDLDEGQSERIENIRKQVGLLRSFADKT